MKKVVVMTTGGTIAMKYDPVTQGLIPAVSGDDLIEAVPALREIAEVEVVRSFCLCEVFHQRFYIFHCVKTLFFIVQIQVSLAVSGA